MWLPTALAFLGLSTQKPFQSPTTMSPSNDFEFKQGPNVFTPKDMLELARPGAPAPNPAGDLILVPVSKYSFNEKKNSKSIYVAPVDASLQPLQIPFPDGGDAFWLDSRTIAHVVESGKDENKKQELHALTVDFKHDSLAAASSVLIDSFPITTAADFRYSAASGTLVFSAYVYPDGDLTKVKAQDEAYEARGNSALVYDETYERQWDTWVGPKHKSLFTVQLSKEQSSWVLGNEYTNALKGTGLSSPVEPFGGTDDFDISDSHIVYTAKDPKLPKAWHTKQDIYYVDFKGAKTVELSSGAQGATHAPVINNQGDKVAWLELDKDGDESDRSKIVIYDLTKDVRYTLTQNWDRSPAVVKFSESGDFLYFTAGDHARVKVFALPVPPTPSASTTNPSLSAPYTTPVELTSARTASALEVLPNNRLLFSLSALTSPSDVYVLRHTDRVETDVKQQAPSVYRGELVQITKFSEDSLQGKTLSEGEDFWFKGSDDRDMHGWILKPPGYSSSDKKKWPIMMVIHGGPESAWEDSWSTRWNLNVFANQGYFVIAMNPTGSTSFGQNLTDGIKGDWGGKPFVDMQKGWKYILDNYPQIDPDRAVAAGASWGGYAINWIQGNPEYGFNFKALFCHDGLFDAAANSLATEELFFTLEEWGGRPWEPKGRELALKYSPSHTVGKWSTPELIVHGSKDFRLAETEGIAAFHALQQLGVPSRLVIFPDENHWVLNHGNSLKWHYEVFRWFDKYVGDKK
ncbi:Alpha/Beta hydrolase protein [Hygrophoropsis aurantiaca]|uniref:Alpha/Beta hydrolase protein n=1 Tax=Hygrophoropsis aurantiaca TaxID=72124 RepID=A0ACB8AGV6_9AGAM|nr:Alpha/Beta hydrolase protein [Hygrophoropsis aurantiaca]